MYGAMLGDTIGAPASLIYIVLRTFIGKLTITVKIINLNT